MISPNGDFEERLAAELRSLQSQIEGLARAPGPKTLLRRFAECLKANYGVTKFEAARLIGKGAKLHLTRRGVRIEGLDAFDDTALEALATAFQQGQAALAELRDGHGRLQIAQHHLNLAWIHDPRSRQGTLVFWEAPSAHSPVVETRVEALVRALQRESRWLRKLDKTQAMLYRDDLTGLFNTRYLELALDNELRRAERFGGQFCLLFIDLDGFKPINDQHGHLAGSEVLRQVADVLREAVREVDLAIRYGGDEFVIVLLGASCAKGLLAAERVRRLVEAKEFQIEGSKSARLTASIGVAAYPEHGQERSVLLKMADDTMYDSKKAGKNRVTVVGRVAYTQSP